MEEILETTKPLFKINGLVKNKIIELRSKGDSIYDICGKLNLSKSRVLYIIKTSESYGN